MLRWGGVTLLAGLLPIGSGRFPSAAAQPAGAAREANVGGYVLHATRDGGYVYAEDGWAVAIAADGTPKFTDRWLFPRTNKVGPVIVSPGPDRAAPSLEGWSARIAPPGVVPTDPWESTRAPISPYRGDPRYACEGDDACAFTPFVIDSSAMGVQTLADATDAYMRRMGQDPYRERKARFLAATLDLRTKMAGRNHTEALRASLEELPARLEALWADPSRPPIEKRQLLWQLWSETADDNGGAMARATIDAFIRRRLPAGSPDAFTSAELARLGAASDGRFAPYAAK
jgi:hypothetical protein